MPLGHKKNISVSLKLYLPLVLSRVNLPSATGRVVGQAKRFSKEITTGVKHSMVPARQMVVLEGHRQLLDEMLPRVQQVILQTKARIFHGDSRSEGKIVSLFEPSAEVIRKGNASNTNRPRD